MWFQFSKRNLDLVIILRPKVLRIETGTLYIRLFLKKSKTEKR